MANPAPCCSNVFLQSGNDGGNEVLAPAKACKRFICFFAPCASFRGETGEARCAHPRCNTVSLSWCVSSLSPRRFRGARHLTRTETEKHRRAAELGDSLPQDVAIVHARRGFGWQQYSHKSWQGSLPCFKQAHRVLAGLPRRVKKPAPSGKASQACKRSIPLKWGQGNNAKASSMFCQACPAAGIWQTKLVNQVARALPTVRTL